MNRNYKLFIYSFAHFAIDFSCFYVLFSGLASKTSLEVTAWGFLAYNIIAFGLQVVIGSIYDKKRRLPSAFIGCILVFLAILIVKCYWGALVIAAIGNAFFHIGAGVSVLKDGKGKMTPNGIFVSTGALGVSLGTLTGKASLLYIPISIMIFTSALIVFISFPKSESNTKAEYIKYNVSSNQPLYIIVFFAFLIVLLRGFIGTITPISWHVAGLLVIIPSVCAFIGKGLGGIIADKYGARRVGTISLLFSIICFIIGTKIVYIGLIGIILFNITMPITLCILASKLPNDLGLAFGISTLGLIIGVIPSFFMIVPQDYKLYIDIVLIIVSIVLLSNIAINQISYEIYKKEREM